MCIKRRARALACQGGCFKQNRVFRRQRKREKMVVGPGSADCKAGYETNDCGELCARWRWLVGRWGVGGINVSREVFETEHGLQKMAKERESGGWTRNKGV